MANIVSSICGSAPNTRTFPNKLDRQFLIWHSHYLHRIINHRVWIRTNSHHEIAHLFWTNSQILIIRFLVGNVRVRCTEYLILQWNTFHWIWQMIIHQIISRLNNFHLIYWQDFASSASNKLKPSAVEHTTHSTHWTNSGLECGKFYGA